MLHVFGTRSNTFPDNEHRWLWVVRRDDTEYVYWIPVKRKNAGAEFLPPGAFNVVLKLTPH